MHKLLPITILCVLLQACGTNYKSKIATADTIIFGRVTAFDHRGENITHNCIDVDENGLFMQKATQGINELRSFTCVLGRREYFTFGMKDIVVDLPKSGAAYYVGDFELTIDSYKPRLESSVSGKFTGFKSSALYYDSLPVKEVTLSKQ